MSTITHCSHYLCNVVGLSTFTSTFDILSTCFYFHVWYSLNLVKLSPLKKCLNGNNFTFQSMISKHHNDFFLSFFLFNYNFIRLQVVYLDYVVLLKGIILICFLVYGFRCSLMILETWQLLMMVLQYWRCYNFLIAFCVQRTTFNQLHFLEVLKDLFKYFGTLIIVIDNVMYLIIYFYVNIMLVWRHLWCYLVTFVVLS